MESDTIRTNIELDRKLVESSLKTRRELVDFALRELLRHKQQKKLLEFKGRVNREGDPWKIADAAKTGHCDTSRACLRSVC